MVLARDCSSDNFTAVPLSAEFTGKVSDRGVDSNRDDRIDKIVVDVELEVHQAGRYRLWLALEKGSRPLFETAFADLEPGRQSVGVEFDTFRLEKSVLRPPYTFSSIRLTHYSDRGAFDIDVLEDAGQTRSYGPDEFDTSPLAVRDPMTDRGVDDDGDGLFDWLMVSVPVEVQRTSRSYFWTAELYTSSGTFVERIRGSKKLEHKVNVLGLLFRGDRIRSSGANGRFEIRAFRFSDGDNSLDLLNLGATQAYSSNQFQTPDPRILAVTPAYSAAGQSDVMVKINAAHTNFKRAQSRASFGPGREDGRRKPIEILRSGQTVPNGWPADPGVAGRAGLEHGDDARLRPRAPGPRAVTVTDAVNLMSKVTIENRLIKVTVEEVNLENEDEVREASTATIGGRAFAPIPTEIPE